MLGNAHGLVCYLQHNLGLEQLDITPGYVHII